MPGYDVAGPEQGSGLLHWSWAAERLTAARHYWVVSTWPDGRPHTMPVWGMWDDAVLWFTSAAGSRKVRNLREDPRCCVTTEDASDPVIIEGTAHFATDQPVLQRVVDLMNAKYRVGIGLDFLAPERNATIGVTPRRVFSMRRSDFNGSPTRWDFSAEERPAED
jgi:PPOX class probable F420-dependent enzyme